MTHIRVWIGSEESKVIAVWPSWQFILCRLGFILLPNIYFQIINSVWNTTSVQSCNFTFLSLFFESTSSYQIFFEFSLTSLASLSPVTWLCSCIFYLLFPRWHYLALWISARIKSSLSCDHLQMQSHVCNSVKSCLPSAGRDYAAEVQESKQDLKVLFGSGRSWRSRSRPEPHLYWSLSRWGANKSLGL